MSFNSYLFVFCFFPAALAGTAILDRLRSRNVFSVVSEKRWYLLVSAVFFAVGDSKALALTAAAGVITYGILKSILATGDTKHRRRLGSVGITLHLLLLLAFKYFNFFAGGVFGLLGKNFRAFQIFLPLGISFLTFQQIALIISCVRGKTERIDPLDYALYLIFFPKLLSGPLCSYEYLCEKLNGAYRNRIKEGRERFWRGGLLFILGLAKKCLLSQDLSSAAAYGMQNAASCSFLELFVSMLCYMLELYFDFSGYCDMGRGVMWMLGMDLPLNFRSPLKSENIVDFWKRWHITLTSFLTDCLYIPLGGSRKGEFRRALNMFVVFAVSGLWHGADMTFVLWGVLNGILYTFHRMIFGKATQEKGKAAALFCRLLCFVLVSALFVPFAAADMAQTTAFFGGMAASLKSAVRAGIPGYALHFGKNFYACFEPDLLWYAVKAVHLAEGQIGHRLCFAAVFGAGIWFGLFSRSADDIAERTEPGMAAALGAAVLFAWCVLSFSGIATYIYVNF